MKFETLNSFNEKVVKIFSPKLKISLSALVMFLMLSWTSINAQYVSKEIAIQRINSEMINITAELNGLFPFTEQHIFLTNLSQCYKLVYGNLRSETNTVADAIEAGLSNFRIPVTPSGMSFSAEASGSSSNYNSNITRSDKTRLEKAVKDLLSL